MIELTGYVAMVLMGIVLGLTGAGGSILTVPILVYLFDVPPTAATGYSLLIVGTTALAGAVGYLRRGQSNPRMAVAFGIPAIAGVYLTRRFLFPAIPDPVLQSGGLVVGRDTAVMMLLATFMLAAAALMIGSDDGSASGRESASGDTASSVFIVLGLAVGVLTGLIGAGGGFIIVPVLVLLGGLPMKDAIGTDLLIIAAKSLVGFVGEMQAVAEVDYAFVGVVTLLPLLGMVIGVTLNRWVPSRILKRIFAWFVLVMAVVIVVRELGLV